MTAPLLEILLSPLPSLGALISKNSSPVHSFVRRLAGWLSRWFGQVCGGRPRAGMGRGERTWNAEPHGHLDGPGGRCSALCWRACASRHIRGHAQGLFVRGKTSSGTEPSVVLSIVVLSIMLPSFFLFCDQVLTTVHHQLFCLSSFAPLPIYYTHARTRAHKHAFLRTQGAPPRGRSSGLSVVSCGLRGPLPRWLHRVHPRGNAARHRSW
jgi:hypothetical protein